MKRSLHLVGIVIILILHGSLPAFAQLALSQPGTIEVQGEAVTEVIPDKAMIILGVNTKGDDPAAVMNANSASVKRVLSILTTFGIAANDIKTSRLSLSETYPNNRFEGSNTLTIYIRELDRLDQLLAHLLKNGINTIQDVRFLSSEKTRLGHELRLSALRDAREKATALAQAAGAQLGDIVKITYAPSAHPSLVSPMRAAPTSNMRNMPVEPGVIALREEVFTIWQLK